MNLSTSTIAKGTAALVAVASFTVGLGGTAVAAATPPAPPKTSSADPAKSLDQIKTAGASAIAQRQTQLTTLSGRLSQAPSCDVNGTVAGIIAADGPALAILGHDLADDTTLADAAKHYRSIFDDYRVYLVVTPQAYATAACGHIDRATDKLTQIQGALDAKVQAAAAGGADMTAAQAALADMDTKIADATAKATHAASTLAAIGPDHGDARVAQANAAAVQAARGDLEAAHTDLTAATTDARTVVAALKAI